VAQTLTRIKDEGKRIIRNMKDKKGNAMRRN
jgi:hypothetical protein